MPRKSFTFKSTGASAGSFLQQLPATLGVDDDSALRGDFYTSVPASNTTADLTFDADPQTYTSALLTWGSTSNFATSLTGVPQVTTLLIVYSASGYPQTVQDGVVVVTTTDASGSFTHTNIPSGKWAYYSLFVLYEVAPLAGRSWYERLGSLEVQIPYDYGSTDDLWKRIPRYYRQQDDILSGDEDDSTRGPLYRMLDVFGWDINRIRTLTDHQMVTKDPDLAEVEVLDALAFEVGCPLTVNDLGPSRLRNLLHNVRINNATKGTISGIQQTLSAVAGAPVEINPLRPERLSTAQQAFSGGIVTTLPTTNQWAYTTAASVSCAASAGGIAVTRGGGTGFQMTVLTTPVQISQASQYRTYYDVFPATGASVVGAVVSTSRFPASSWNLSASSGFISTGPDSWQRHLSGTDIWYQAPLDHGIVGDGTFTSTTAYVHIVVVLGPGSTSLLIKNPSLIALDTYPYTIDVYSERANLVKDPQFFSPTNNATSASVNFWNWSKTGGTVAVASANDRLTATVTGSTATITYNTNVTNRLTPVRAGLEYSFSVIDNGDRITSVSLKSRTYGTLATATTPYRSVTTLSGNRRYWLLFKEYDAPWVPLNMSDCFVEFTATVPVGTHVLYQPLLEYSFRAGTYFDGENTNGGWLRSGSVSTISGTADYRWGTGGENQSFSYYATDYARMVNSINKLLPYVLPVTETTVTVRFNRLFGYPGTDMP